MFKNTRTSKDIINKLEEVAFIDAKKSDMKRENANVDGNTSMGQMLQYGSIASKEVAKKIINEAHIRAHENGDIHIHDMDFASIGTSTCSQIDLKKLFRKGFSTGHGFLREPNSISSYASLAAIAIQANQNDQHGGQSIPAFDFYLRDGVIKSFRKKVKQNISKYLDVKLELDDEKVEEITEEILNKYGKINSIEFTEQDIERLSIIILGQFIVLGVKDNKKAIKISEKMIDFIMKRSLREVDRETYQAMEGFVHNLNTMNSRAGSQTPFSSINFGTDTSPEGRMVTKNLLLAQEAGLGNGETPIFPILIFKTKKGINLYEGDPNYDLFQLACRVSGKRMFPNFAFLDAPFNLQYYKEGNFDTEVAYMGCRTRTIGNINGDEIVTGRGNLSFTSINLPRIGLKYGVAINDNLDLDGFFEELDYWIELVINQLLDRFNFQSNKKVKNFPFLMGQGVWKGSESLSPDDFLKDVIKEGSLTVGFIGLAETLIALIGEHHGESEEARELGLKIITHMRKRMDEATKRHNLNFALIATPAEGLSGRFVRMDKEQFGVIDHVTDKEYYTNSFHVPVGYKISAYKKITIEAPYHALTNGGHISYIELDGDISHNPEAFEKIIQAMAESGIGYGSINHPIDIDPVCGFRGIIYEECPQCGRREKIDGIPFERIRRITGYLVGTTDRFNDAKKAEEHDRVKHM